MRSPYAVLGISKTARDNDIKEAYRKLAKLWHPDQNHSDPQAAEVFAEINNAYQLLTDPPRRKLFDDGKIDANGRRRKKRTFVRDGFNPFSKASGKDKQEPAPQKTDEKSSSSAANASKSSTSQKPEAPKKPETSKKNAKDASYDDLVTEIFGSEDERKATATQERARKASSESSENYHEAAMSVLDDAFTKFEKHRATSTTQAPDRYYDIDVELAEIFTGVTLPILPHVKNSLNVYVAPGTPDGGQIRIENMGNCRKGEIPGDVVVTVRYKSNEQFWVRNGELHTHLAVDLADAVLGGEVVAQTPDGPATFNLPEWTSSNHIIRIPKRGLPNQSGERGDLCANVCILLPEKPNPQLKELLKSTRKSWFM